MLSQRHRRPGLTLALPLAILLGSIGISASQAALPETAQPTKVSLSPQDVAGKFIAVCDYSHTSKDDPILHFGDNNAAHRHDFFGNAYTNENSTPATLRGPTFGLGPHTTCDDRPLNRSAYWTPVLFAPLDTPDRQVPSITRNYYRDGGVSDDSRDDIQTFPLGFSMIAGNAHIMAVDDPQPLRVVQWSCIETGDPEVQDEFETIDAAIAATGSVTNTCPSPAESDGEYSGELRVRIDFPSCWDGDTDWPWSGSYSVDTHSTRGHMRYPWENAAGDDVSQIEDRPNEECPTGSYDGHTFDTRLPQLQVSVRWYVADIDLTGAHLASDASGEDDHGQADNGGTAHADFMNGWMTNTAELPVVNELDRLVDECIKLPDDCGETGP